MARARFIQALSPIQHWSRFRLLLTVLVIARGVVLLCVMPPLEGWDEYQHVGYIQYVIENGRDPVFGEACVPASVLRGVAAFPHGASAIEQIGGHGAVRPAEFWAGGARPGGDGALPLVVLYQAQHASLYYRVARPVFEAAGGVNDLRASVGALRLANVVLAAGAVWMVLGGLGRWCRDRRHAALIGLIVAVQPLFVINAARVANDGLAVFLATVVIVWAMELDERRLWRRSVAIGLVVGLAILAKTVNLALLPFVVGCVLLLVVRGRVRVGAAVVGLVLFAAGAAVVTQHYFRFNLARFGVMTPMQEALANRAEGRDADELATAAGEVRWGRFMRNMWLKRWMWMGGWSFVATPRLFRDACEVTCDLGLLGWLFMLRRRAREERRVFAAPLVALRAFWLCVCFAVALCWHGIQSQAAWGTTSTNVWYAAAAFAWWIMVIYCGAMGWPGGWWKYVIPLHLAWLFVLTQAVGIFGAMVRMYANVGLGAEALRRLASLQPGWLGTGTLVGASTLCAILIIAALAGWVGAVREGAATGSLARDLDQPIRR